MKLKTRIDQEDRDVIVESLSYIRKHVRNGTDHFHITRIEAALLERPNIAPEEDED